MNTGDKTQNQKHKTKLKANLIEIIEDRREEPLLNLLDSLGGWPVLVGNRWNGDNFDWVEVLT